MMDSFACFFCCLLSFTKIFVLSISSGRFTQVLLYIILATGFQYLGRMNRTSFKVLYETNVNLIMCG